LLNGGLPASAHPWLLSAAVDFFFEKAANMPETKAANLFRKWAPIFKNAVKKWYANN